MASSHRRRYRPAVRTVRIRHPPPPLDAPRAELGGPTMFAPIGVMSALNRNVERTPNRTAASATQFRTNPVSGRRLPKTGIFQIFAGDYRRFRSRSGQFRSPETDRQFAKARHWRAFLRVQRVKSPGAGLVGWRRSADRTSLQANSLVSGNFTGNFAILGPIDTI